MLCCQLPAVTNSALCRLCADVLLHPWLCQRGGEQPPTCPQLAGVVVRGPVGRSSHLPPALSIHSLNVHQSPTERGLSKEKAQ